MSKLYEQDFYQWTQETARALREGRLADIDLENAAEEIEDLGNSLRKELQHRLEILTGHLLKWTHQPDLRNNSWKATLHIQRKELAKLIRQNPSLKSVLSAAFEEGYADGRELAALETGFWIDDFPHTCPWSIEEVLDADFYPRAAGE